MLYYEACGEMDDTIMFDDAINVGRFDDARVAMAVGGLPVESSCMPAEQKQTFSTEASWPSKVLRHV